MWVMLSILQQASQVYDCLFPVGLRSGNSQWIALSQPTQSLYVAIPSFYQEEEELLGKLAIISGVSKKDREACWDHVDSQRGRGVFTRERNHSILSLSDGTTYHTLILPV